MEHPDSKETGEENGASAVGDNAERPTSSSNSGIPSDPWPNTAIERQIASTSTFGYRKRSYQEAPGRGAGRHKMVYSTDRRKSRLGLAIFLAFLLLVAAGLAWLFTNLGRPLQGAVSVVPSTVEQAAAPHNPPPVNAVQATAPKKVAEVATSGTSGELSIPIADASLRSRPELLEQLVQVYRSKLASDPNDATAQTALNQLRERSLAELETIIAEGDDSAAGSSLQIVSRLFPELAENSRYKYLTVRMDYIHRQATDELAAKSEQSAAAPAPEKTISPEKTASSEKAVSPPIDSSMTVAKKAVEKTQPLKPEIRAVSITPGNMVENRFVPSEGGNALMVEISYRNFEKTFEDSSEVTLVTRLGIPGDATVLAEVPVVISGDRGTKSFLMDTLMSGNTDKKYQLNFLLDGKFFASRMVRVSIPGQ
jgi:hypothetical protein